MTFIRGSGPKNSWLSASLKWILLTVLLAGCSSTSFVYNNVDWLIVDRIDDYFSLSSSQQGQLEVDIDDILKWHRQQELGRYSDELDQFVEHYSDGLTRDELGLLFDAISAARIRLVEAGMPAASRFLTTVSPEQIDHYDTVFLEKSAERAEDLALSNEEYADKSFDDLIDNLEDWFGDFNDKQMAQLRVMSDNRPKNRQYWFEHRNLRHQTFSNLLRSNPSRLTIEAYLRDRFVLLKRTDTQHQKTSREERTYWIDTLLAIDKMITSEQRQHFTSRISDYSFDFLTLSKDSGNPFNSNGR